MKTLIFDTETTDIIRNKLIPLDRQPQVIEFFGLTLEEEKETGSFNQLFDPGKKLSAEVKSITNIDDAMLVGKPKFAAHASEIRDFICSHDVVVAHNLSFDRTMIEIELRRCNLAIKWPRLICTVEATEHIKGHRLSLSALHEHLFGEAFAGAHRAEHDVRALARCFIELKKRGVL